VVLRAVLAEDNLPVRQGVTTLLATSGVEVVAACADAGELFAAVDRHDPDVVITDIRMPPTHTDEAIRAAADLRRRRPDLGVLVLSHYLEVRTAVGAGTTVAGVLPAHPCTRPPAVGWLDHPR
jgi:DNA-binding NarL/FixJ family response regulator